MVKIGAFIQAHFSDEQCLVPLNNKPSIEHVLMKMKNIVEEVIVVTPDDRNNNIFKDIVHQHGALLFMGDKENVARRLLDAANKFDVDVIVRAPAIKPFINEQLASCMLAEFIQLSDSVDLLRVPYDYYQNFAVEIFSTAALKRVVEQLVIIEPIYKYKPHYYMDLHPEEFSVKVYEQVPCYSEEEKKQIQMMMNSMKHAGKDSERPGQGHNDFFPSTFEVESRYDYFVSAITTDDVVLDIACGNGLGTKKYAHAKQVIGVDYDEGAIVNADSIMSIPNISFEQGDANIYKRKNYFTKILSFETVEHISEREQFINNMYSSLKPEGHFIISTPIRKEAGLTGHPHHLYEYSIIEFEKLLIQNGFEIKQKLGQDYRGIITDNLNNECRGMLFVCIKSRID